MGAIEDHHVYAIQLRESANDGSDFGLPDTDYRYEFLGEDGLLKLKDSAGTVIDVGGGSGAVASDPIWDAAGDIAVGTGADAAHRVAAGSAGSRLVSAGAADPVWTAFPKVINRLGSGDVSITATTNVFASNITGLGDITLAAVTGDYIEAGVAALCPNSTAQSLKMDVCTVVSAAAVNFFSNGTNTGATNGVPAWYMTASLSAAKAGGSVIYQAQSGDLSGGNIVLRLLCFGTGTRTIGASTATSPLIFWAQNLRQ